MPQIGQQQTRPPNLGPGEPNPPEWVHYLQELLNYFYQMQVVNLDGKYGSQTQGAVEHLRGQLHLSAEAVVDEDVWRVLEGTTSASDEDGIGEDVDKSVTLVTGDEETSWAAAIAMVTTSNGNTNDLDAVLARSPQRRRTAAEASRFAAAEYGLSSHDCHPTQPQSWAGVLRAHGALWVAAPNDEYWVFVVAGIRTEEGNKVKMHVLDPRDGEDWYEFAEIVRYYQFSEGTIQVLAGG